MASERDSRRAVLDHALSYVLARVDQVGFDGLTDNQKVLLCVDDLYWSDFVEYFCRREAFLEELVGEGEPSEADWAQSDAFEAEQEKRRDWAAAGLQRIGAAQAAEAFIRARRGSSWQKWEKRFRQAEDVEELLVAFVQEHPEDFRPAGAG